MDLCTPNTKQNSNPTTNSRTGHTPTINSTCCTSLSVSSPRFDLETTYPLIAGKFFKSSYFLLHENLGCYRSETYKLANMKGEVYTNAWNVDLLRWFYT